MTEVKENWQEGVISARSAPGHAVVQVGESGFLLEHDPSLDNRLAIGVALRVVVDQSRVIDWQPQTVRPKR